MAYSAPVEDIRFILHDVAGLDRLIADGLAGDLDASLLDALLEEAGNTAAGLLEPLNTVGDRTGCALTDTGVVTPPGFPAAYAAWREGGWNGIDASTGHGGMGLPTAVSAAVMEIWNGANMAFTLAPVLTQGAVEAIAAHGDPDLKAAYLDKMVSGEWAAAMALTEPSAGSDLSNLRAKATPAGDGTYRLFGSKIFITYGDHDLTDNIVHLVLARLPDAPEGTKGISLFLAPKILPDGTRNDFRCTGLEHKLGIHASPTCSMTYGEKDGAVAWLIGAPNNGLACMFTMMNRARLATGLQGVGVAEAATQHAYAYARDRRQGRAGTHAIAPIVEHPDVARMLLDMRSQTFAARAIAYSAGVAIDRATRETDPARKAAASAREALLIPIIKAYGSDIGVEVASTGVQVHGGMGYIEETGAAQFLRDARIVPIYEGTNGIQAIDLVGRKVVRDGGAAACALIAELTAIASNAKGQPLLAQAPAQLDWALECLTQTTDWLLDAARTEAERLGGATPYLTLFATTLGGALLIKGALKAGAPADMTALARHYATTRLTHAGALAVQVQSGVGALAAEGAMGAYL
jgi:alkylation response protein AidB-like acyl-CoA dehydrogenase